MGKSKPSTELGQNRPLPDESPRYPCKLDNPTSNSFAMGSDSVRWKLDSELPELVATPHQLELVCVLDTDPDSDDDLGFALDRYPGFASELERGSKLRFERRCEFDPGWELEFQTELDAGCEVDHRFHIERAPEPDAEPERYLDSGRLDRELELVARLELRLASHVDLAYRLELQPRLRLVHESELDHFQPGNDIPASFDTAAVAREIGETPRMFAWSPC